MLVGRWDFGSSEIDGKNRPALRTRKEQKMVTQRMTQTEAQKLVTEIGNKIIWVWILLRAFKLLNLLEIKESTENMCVVDEECFLP